VAENHHVWLTSAMRRVSMCNAFNHLGLAVEVHFHDA